VVCLNGLVVSVLVSALVSICALSKILERSSIPKEIASLIYGTPLRREIYERVVFYNPHGVGLSQIARELEIRRQVAQYHLKILEESGVVYRDEAGRYLPKIRVFLKSYAIPESTAFHFANLAFFAYFAGLLITYLLSPNPIFALAAMISAAIFSIYHYIDKVLSK